MNITKSFVDKLSIPKQLQPGRTEQKRYYDDKLKGFGVRVTSGGTKAFFIEKLINGQLKRITLGQYPAITTEQARKEAQKTLGKIATGIDPVAEKKAQKVKSITLEQAFNDYLAARKSLKPTTVIDYQRVLKQVVPDWLNKPLLHISRDLIVKRHSQHGENHSQARANLAMRLIRAIFNFAMNEYHSDSGKAIILENPVARLSHTRAWYRIERRQTVIKHHELAAWYQGLIRLSEKRAIENAELWQDYFLLILFTGLRRSEAASLKWENVDLKSKSFTLLDTKNRDSHTLPMSDFLFDLFIRRRQANPKSEFVFPAENSSRGHIVEPRKAMLKVAELSNVEFTVHDLRRTFITTAESLDISAYALKRLLNHKMANDVTSGYIITDVERLRKPMQEITDYLLKCIGIKNTPIIPLLTKAK
ncbi:MAG: putative phage-related integrase [Gammaproteobacteria bacterium]|jgi:integrase|nr:putative phage-related integrase [Gammaproteobacteria bacterium]